MAALSLIPQSFNGRCTIQNINVTALSLYILYIILCLHAGAALEIFVPPTYQVRVGSSALIPCTYTVGSHPVDPTYFAAFWHFQGKQILSYDDQVRTIDSRYSINTERVLNGIVDLSISKITISDAGVYTCSVLYSPTQKKKGINVDVEAPPRIVMTNKTVGVNEESVLSCSITGFYPEDVTITWLRGTEILGHVTMDGPRSNSDGTFSVDSSVTITPTEEDRARDFSCRVQHESLKEPLQIDFKLRYRETKSVNQTLYIIIIVILVVVVILAMVILAIIYHKHKRRRQDNRNTQMPLTSAKNDDPETGEGQPKPVEIKAEPSFSLQQTTQNFVMGSCQPSPICWDSSGKLLSRALTGQDNRNTQMPLTSAKNDDPETAHKKEPKIPEKKIPQNQIKASNQNMTPRKTSLEYKNVEEETFTPVKERVSIIENNLKAQGQIHEPLAEQKADQQGEYDNPMKIQKSPQFGNQKEIKHSNSKEDNKLSGEEETEEHSLSTNPLDEKEIDTSGERSKREDEEEVNQEKEDNEKPSELIDTSSSKDETEVEEDFLKMRGMDSSGFCSIEESPDDHDNEETLLMSNNLEKRLRDHSTSEIVRGNSDRNLTQQLSNDDGFQERLFFLDTESERVTVDFT
ncbi:uncharacterized protein LOC130285343 [Hyla sarda]|uniref:uncharacterized protein LOC130285343 n=1 Tax=Hyla sarda TaxID=327740 RepID=UPI0024C364ED|nr:uncharacterized protein LOC130285343 [Hyla sarda]